MLRLTRLFLLTWFMLSSLCCMHPISKPIRKEIEKDISFEQLRKDPDAFIGKIVLLGGEIIKTQNKKDGTELEILQKRLDIWSRPRDEDRTGGRFIVIVSDFLDPVIYHEGRKITVAGEVIGKTVRKLGEVDYQYPVLKAKEVHLWRDYTERIYYYPYPVWYYWDYYYLHWMY